jgi:peptidoglycan biosynthesis protein MviN/MurJ (putative lipid II flippase)
VHASVTSKKSTLMSIVLPGTAALAICGGIALCVLGPWVVRVVYKQSYVADTTALLPWYAGAMVPLALANVLANDLLARGRFRVVPAMVALTIAYGLALPYVLGHSHGQAGLKAVLQTLGLFNLLLLGVCGCFAWMDSRAVVKEKT